MAERLFGSVKELFGVVAPDLLDYLKADDSFWKQVAENTITETELKGHQVLLEELGCTPADSAVLKAIYEIRRLRQSVLPTPLECYLGNSPRH
jgi:hypothetical protein